MIEEQAIVVAFDKEYITFETQKKTACGSCRVNKTCGTGIISNYIKPKTTKFVVANTIDNISIGDTIVIGINEREFLFGSFIMYILPLCFLIISALISDYIATIYNIENKEILVIAMSGISFFSSFVFIRNILQNKFHLLNINPELIRKIKI